jgi:catechol 2,3-dioxygenase-like lactoylglutathione lyase family enzyme
MKFFYLYLACVLLLLVSCGHEAKVTDSQSTLPAVDHILLEVKNLDRSVKFYHDELGLEIKKRSGDFAVLEAANIGIYLWSKRWKWSPPPPDSGRPPQGMYPHFVVPDVKGLVERLRHKGYQIVADPKEHSYGTEAFVADPDGFVWALISK